MSVRTAALAGRRAAESRMGAGNGGSTVTVRRKHPTEKVRDTANGTEVPRWDVVAADVPARISPQDVTRHTVVRGGVEVEVTARRVDLPWSYESTVDVDDYIDVTSGDWRGLALRVEARKGQTALRLVSEEMQRPTEWG